MVELPPGFVARQVTTGDQAFDRGIDRAVPRRDLLQGQQRLLIEASARQDDRTQERRTSIRYR